VGKNILGVVRKELFIAASVEHACIKGRLQRKKLKMQYLKKKWTNTRIYRRRENMSEYKNIHAVIDNYHEGAFPVIAICPTHEAAEEYIADRIKEDKQKGNNYDYDIAEVAVGWDMSTAAEPAQAI